MNITEVLVPAQEIAWQPWAVQYFFYIGSSYAATILFFIALIFKKQTSHAFRSALVLVMVIGAIVGPLALTGDLHQPGRVGNFYLNLTSWSWMSLGSLFLPVFSGLTVITSWLYLRDDLANLKSNSNPVLRRLGWLTLGQWQVSAQWMVFVSLATLCSGLSVALYTGAEFAVIESRPLWNQPASPLLWFVTAFLAAIGLTILIRALFPSQKHKEFTSFDMKIIQRTGGVSAVLALILLPIWASNNPTFSLYENSSWVINLSTVAISLLASKRFILTLKKAGNPLIIVATLTAAWAVRWVTMIEVQTIPRFDAGTFPYQMTLDGAGVLAIAGMFGLWIALALFASELLSSKTPTYHHSSDSVHS